MLATRKVSASDMSREKLQNRKSYVTTSPRATSPTWQQREGTSCWTWRSMAEELNQCVWEAKRKLPSESLPTTTLLSGTNLASPRLHQTAAVAVAWTGGNPSTRLLKKFILYFTPLWCWPTELTSVGQAARSFLSLSTFPSHWLAARTPPDVVSYSPVLSVCGSFFGVGWMTGEFSLGCCM